MPPPLQYGFLKDVPPYTQLRQALGLQRLPEALKFDSVVWITSIRQLKHKALWKKYMTPKRVVDDQLCALEAIEAELPRIYPELYSGPEKKRRLYFSRRYIMQIHNQRRLRCLQDEKKARDQDAYRGDDSGPRRKGRPRTRSSVASARRSMSVIDLSSDGPDESSSSPTTQKAGQKGISVGRPSLNLSVIEKSSDAPIVHSISRVPSHPSTNAVSSNTSSKAFSSRDLQLSGGTNSLAVESGSRGEGYAAVYNFLKACEPSMAHLLHKFLENGCNSEKKLKLLAEWEQSDRMNWLRNVLSGEVVGRAVKDMDIEILDNNLETYFA
ncbi:hypothetical protein CPC08DRAFT_723148 [Agrocybe pediades]|nr:hypothetical protein CPC08DRAFT_723148 [Agrocybe pediades]